MKAKRADHMQLRALSVALRSSRGTPRAMRLKFAAVLDRYLRDDYPRPNGRPDKSERNAWLAVDYLIRCAAPGATKTAESVALSEECAKADIAITDTAIRKLPAKHPRAKGVAAQLIESAQGRYAEAIREATWHWQRAELD